MLPNNRSARLNGFAISSMMLSGVNAIRAQSGSSNGLVKRRRYPRNPSTWMLYHCTITMTASAIASVRLMSAAAGSTGAANGKKSSQLAKRMKMKMVAAMGSDELRVVADHLLDQVADVAEQQLEDHLELARFARAETARDPEADRERHHDRDAARDQRVVVERAEELLPAYLDDRMRPGRRMSGKRSCDSQLFTQRGRGKTT